MNISKYNESFIGEANEQLTEMNKLLLILEKDHKNIDALNDFFRVIHTLKGTSAILGHMEIQNVSHLMEDLLDKLRSKEIDFNQENIDILFEGVDTLETMIDNVAKEKKQIHGKELISKLNASLISEAEKTADKESNTADEILDLKDIIFMLKPEEKKTLGAEIKKGSNTSLITIIIDEKCKLVEGRAHQIFRDLKEFGSIIRSVPDKEEIGILEGSRSFQIIFSTSKNEEEIEDVIYQTPEVNNIISEPIDSLSNQKVEENNRSKTISAGETIRVNVQLLDALLNLVGENMINNIQINQIASQHKNKNLDVALKASNRLTEDLQHYVLQMRMVPIDHIFRLFPRMVRDMAKDGDKEINLVLEGGDIEMDRGLLDEIGDSLVHLLRNAIDHGIEPSDARMKAGKEKAGTIRLSAHRDQSYIVIDISDDGKGIDVDRLTKAAIEKGNVSEKDAEAMNVDERLSLMFLPGVTTAKEITDISGRGVGLDVVYSKINSLGGTVNIKTDVGKGTKMTIKLPPTMAIIKALLINIGDETYALPLENVAETVLINHEMVHTVGKRDMFKLRDEILPLFDLNNEFIGASTRDDSGLSAVIVEKDSTRVGLIVNDFIGQQEIVVKTVGGELRRSKYFSGATILGDGSVAMIIDVGAFT
ncbi:MAG: chemotaxis protein CheA [Thermoplasmata archaeon]|nr:chemotaxis protein CheA [Thermoplasmata archaeon]